MTAYSVKRTNKSKVVFNNFRDAIICCAADGFTSLYGGFVIFSVIGYIAHDANMNITSVATSGKYVRLLKIDIFITPHNSFLISSKKTYVVVLTTYVFVEK